jgi:UDP-GlcNAc3NAcA epimerase
MKIVTVLGARPQFVKAAAVSAAILRHNAAERAQPIAEVIVHTGQHYDDNMSRIFFEQLGTPLPKHNLGVGSASHGAMTGKMLLGIEPILLEEKPDWVLVYGDTNSTLAGALAASKLHLPVCHVEAGLRSFDKRMPEEQNRILTDHLSTLLMCPTRAALANLASEGVARGVHHVGDVMFDAALVFGPVAEASSTLLERLGLTPRAYYLCTVHRAENTDVPERLGAIVDALRELGRPDCPVVLPLHPRTRGYLERSGKAASISHDLALRTLEPVGFLDMLLLEKHARLILTDSGGVQKEAYFHGVPCVTLRDETEWVETVESGWNRLAGADRARILEAAAASRPGRAIDEYGRGQAADKIVEILTAWEPRAWSG